jgi:hypothetical protein
MKISEDRGKISDLAGKRDISEISDSIGRYFFPWLQLPDVLPVPGYLAIWNAERCLCVTVCNV